MFKALEFHYLIVPWENYLLNEEKLAKKDQ